MKRLSTEPAGSASAEVRAARFDRPLFNGGGHSWGDIEVDRQVRSAIEEGRDQGRAAGFAVGWSQGRQAGAARVQAEAAEREAADAVRRAQEVTRLQAVLAGLQKVAAEQELAHEPAWHEVADAITDGALQLARAVLGRELAAVDGPALEAVRHAVRALGDPGQVTVRLSPADHAVVQQLTGRSRAGAGPAGTELPDGVRLVADPELGDGEVQAATPAQRLRLHLPSALAAAEQVLRG